MLLMETSKRKLSHTDLLAACTVHTQAQPHLQIYSSNECSTAKYISVFTGVVRPLWLLPFKCSQCCRCVYVNRGRYSISVSPRQLHRVLTTIQHCVPGIVEQFECLCSDGEGNYSVLSSCQMHALKSCQSRARERNAGVVDTQISSVRHVVQHDNLIPFPCSEVCDCCGDGRVGCWRHNQRCRRSGPLQRIRVQRQAMSKREQRGTEFVRVVLVRAHARSPGTNTHVGHVILHKRFRIDGHWQFTPSVAPSLTVQRARDSIGTLDAGVEGFHNSVGLEVVHGHCASVHDHDHQWCAWCSLTHSLDELVLYTVQC
eukprot:m.26786 g.26786  ORF g.26786 m.26786 type:complete len:314 (-) comp13381_c0_seq2:1752-2693(-)